MLLWTMISVAICLTFAQEIAARMGVIIGNLGLEDLGARCPTDKSAG